MKPPEIAKYQTKLINTIKRPIPAGAARAACFGTIVGQCKQLPFRIVIHNCADDGHEAPSDSMAILTMKIVHLSQKLILC